MDLNANFEELMEKFGNALIDKGKSDIQRLEEKRIQRMMNAYRTELCRIYRTFGMCRYGDACRFAHSNEQLRFRQLPHNYKTKLCRNFEQFGSCIYGAKCLYIHRAPLLPNRQMPLHFSSSYPSGHFSVWNE